MPLPSWLSANRSRLLAALVGVGVLVSGTWQLINSRTTQLFGGLTARVETTRPVLALTFDDGPVGHGPVLDTLKAHRVPATFFVCGGSMDTPEQLAIARRMVTEGHELGNHSYSHQRMILKSPGWVAHEVEATDRLIRDAGHRGPIHFRPPYGKKFLVLPFYMAQNGRKTIMWDVEPETDPAIAWSSERIVTHVLANARPGSIILLHGARRATQAAVGPIVKGLAEQGFRWVTVWDLLAQAP